jgi:pheromone shutdown-related protein TraB
MLRDRVAHGLPGNDPALRRLMIDTPDNSIQTDPFAGQPTDIVERDGIRYTLLGTAHVSKASVDAVRAAIASGDFDQIAVELDPQRLQALTDPDALAKLDLIKVLREGKTALFAANLALAGYQRRLAEKLGIEPGAELKVAALQAKALDLPLHLIDRDVGLTFRRAMRRLGWWGRAKISAGLLAGMVANEEVEEADIEKLKEGDMLESAFGEFASQTPELYDTIIAERDRYMAARLRESATPGHVLVVIGAGHLQGLARHLREDSDAPALVREELESVPKKSSIPWFTLAITTLIVGSFAYGFWHGGFNLGASLILQWVMFTGGLGALGCLLAGGHPLSIITAFVAAPLKPFHPGVPAGTFSALVEAWIRKPIYGDFLDLRDDVQSLRGWYRNRVARVLVNFMLTNLGTAIGVWIGGARILSKVLS